MRTKILSTSGFLITVLGIINLAKNGYIISDNLLVITIQVLALCLMIWARLIFKGRSFHLTADPTEGGLVTSGPYKWFRHPIYAAAIYFSLACLIAHPNIKALLAVISITGGLFIRMILEEEALKQTYPEYTEYSKKAKRVIPFIY